MQKRCACADMHPGMLLVVPDSSQAASSLILLLLLSENMTSILPLIGI